MDPLIVPPLPPSEIADLNRAVCDAYLAWADRRDELGYYDPRTRILRYRLDHLKAKMTYEEGRLRTWTDATGEFPIRATMAQVMGG